MSKHSIVTLMAIVAIAAGCQTNEETEALYEGIRRIDIPRGSVVSYAPVSSGTQFMPSRHMGGANAVSLRGEGYVLFVDEMPKYNWAHSFRVVFLPKGTVEPEVLFRGSAIPDFRFQSPDGSVVTNWSKY
jgi:hypothetical protein